MMTEKIKLVKSLLDVENDWAHYKKRPIVIKAALLTEKILVKTLEGDMTGNPGDYLIQGVEGELYPCKSVHLRSIMKLSLM